MALVFGRISQDTKRRAPLSECVRGGPFSWTLDDNETGKTLACGQVESAAEAIERMFYYAKLFGLSFVENKDSGPVFTKS